MRFLILSCYHSQTGRGGFGHVVLCKNKLDGRRYAMKKIRLKDKSPVLNDKILRSYSSYHRSIYTIEL